MKQIGCLHAHHSNIQFTERIFTDLPIKASHFVDPGLIHFQKNNTDTCQLSKRIVNKLKWIEKTGVDMIFITCTNYITLLEDIKLDINIPVLKIDEPFFEEIKQTSRPVQVIFTNEGTVAGTMGRLHNYLRGQISFPIEYEVIPKAFDLYMHGKTTEHDQHLSEFLVNQDFKKQTIAVAQLSMSNAAIEYSNKNKQFIINPLSAMKNHLLKHLNSEEKKSEHAAASKKT